MSERVHKHSYERGILWMMSSAAALSFSYFFLKVNLSYINYIPLIFLRFGVPFLLTFLLITLFSQWRDVLASSHFKLQVLRCMCMLVAQYGLAYYIAHNTLLNATVLLNAAPLFIPVIEWIFLKRRPGKSTILSVLIAFLGVILVLHPDKALFSAVSGIGLLAALGQAGSQVLYGLRSKTDNLLVNAFILFALSTLFAGMVALVFGSDKGFLIPQASPVHAGYLVATLVLMGAGTLLNQYFQGLAYRCGSPSTLSTFLYFSVFVSAILDWFVLRQVPNVLTIIGACLIILGGILKVVLRTHFLKKK